jgi:hypothetical protein
VVSLSRGSPPASTSEEVGGFAETPAESAALAAHLRAIGARCDESVVVDRHAPRFGQVHHGSAGDLRPKSDLQAALEASLARVTADWCAEHAEQAEHPEHAESPEHAGGPRPEPSPWTPGATA